MERMLPFLRLVLLLCLCIAYTSSFSQGQSAKSNASEVAKTNAFASATLMYKIVNAPKNTYGYDVWLNEKLFIHQPSIPALSGNEGFKTKEQAAKVAQLVISKIRKGELPPTVTINELRKLNAIQ